MHGLLSSYLDAGSLLPQRESRLRRLQLLPALAGTKPWLAARDKLAKSTVRIANR